MRSMWLLLFSIIFLLASRLQAQKKINISGILILEEMPLRGATIRLINNSNDSLIAFKISDGNGFFQMNAMVLDGGTYSLYLSHVATMDSSFNILLSDLVELGWHKMIVMKRKDIILEKIIINASILPFKIRGDTVIYDASRYMKEDVHKVEDLLKNMEGFTVEGDGQIRYNGKELGKILIEGEDMTGDRYKILSKNIQANLISKVEVLHNFNDNRLLKEVENSDRIALNLTFKEDKKNKFNGTANLGFGFPKKGYADIDVVGIHKKMKSLNFINKNNIGLDVNDDIIYYWDEKNGSNENISKGIRTESPIQRFGMAFPDLKKTYTTRNNDFSFVSIESFRVSKYSIIKFLTTVGNENKLMEGSYLRRFYFQSEPSWEQKSINFLSAKKWGGGNKISYQTDNGGNRTGVYEVSFSISQSERFFNGRNEGFILDTLKERFSENISALNFSGIETIRLKSGLILKVDYFSSKPFYKSAIQTGSERYDDIFLNMNFEKEYQQNLIKSGNSNQLDISVLSKKNKFSKTWGIHARQENIYYRTILENRYNERPIKLQENKINYNFWKIYSYGSVGYQASKKTNMELHAAAGMAKIFSGVAENISSEIFNSKLSVTYKLSALNQLQATASFSKRTPLIDYFFPQNIIIGNASITDGIQIPSFPISKSLQIGYYRNNLYSGISFSTFFSANIISRDNSFSIFILPTFVRTSFYISKQGAHFSNNTKFEKYFYNIKVNSAFKFGFSHARTPERINALNTISNLSSTMFQLHLVSNWKSILNFEGNASTLFSSFLSAQGINKKVMRTSISLKPKIAVTNKINAGIYFAKFKNQLQPSFYLCDMQGQWKVGNFARFTLTAHNLLNNRIFADKEYSLFGYSEQQFVLAARYLIVGWQLDF